MSDVFGADYAAAYDLLYGDKDYEAEVELVERLLAGRGVASILDLGCGTGGHAVPLARRGYEVVGVDRSEPMLAHAREKAAGLPAKFALGDVRDVDLGREFDAALMLFAVLGYQVDDQDAVAALASARRHLRPGGLLLFDAWYAPAVLAQRPSERHRVVERDGIRLERTSTGRLDPERAVCHVGFSLRRTEAGGATSTFAESHEMRYFDEAELESLTRAAGLDLVRLGAFPEVEREPDTSTWSVLGVAEAR